MSDIVYSNKEKKEIIKTKKLLLKDLLEILKLGSTSEVTVYFEGKEKERKYMLMIDKNLILLCQSYTYSWGDIRRIICNFDQFGKMTIPDEISSLDFIFIDLYDKIREEVLKEVEKNLEEKEKNLQIIRKQQHKYSNEVVLSLNIPDALNQNVIKVIEEEDRKIGTIDFGGHTIKIITSSDIVLVKEEQELPPKQKKKM